MGHPAWADEPAFATAEARYEHTHELDEKVNAWTRSRDSYEVAALLQARGVPAGVVQNSADIVHRDGQMQDFGFWWSSDELTTPFRRMDGFPVHMSQTDPQLRKLGPKMGQDDEAVFGELLGLSKEEIVELQASEVIW
jgi:crotonobetainyl-CoA:carnitine CoA-transferase CaiB-like acyl-CoA transferase